MSEDKYKVVANMIKEIFEKEFGRFNIEDLKKVMKELDYGIFENRVDFDEFYKNLSDNEREFVDFMMKL